MARSCIRWHVVLLTACILAAPECYGQRPAGPADEHAGAATKRPTYQLDRSEENWSLLRDPTLRTDPWDRLKYLPLGRAGWYLTLGGETRSFYELYRNYNWGAGAQDGGGYFLQRFMGSADLHLGDDTRFFVEMRSGLVGGRNGGPRPSQDKDTLDVSQAFAAFVLVRGKEKPKFEVKLGRQELNYGEGSLIAIRELNVRRTFDGVKMTLRPGTWKVDLLAFRPQLIRTGAFDDGIDSSQALWGVWATRPIPRRPFWRQVDVYYLGMDRKRARFEQGTAREQRQTLGMLLHGQRGAFSMFAEADLQFGRFGAGSLRAWKYAQGLSWTFRTRPLSPVVSLLGAVASGDNDPASPGLQTFNPLFPRGLYYGYIDSTGSPNATVIHPEVSFNLSPSVSVMVTHFSFWRTRLADGMYSQPGFFLRSGNKNQSRYVGSLQDLSITWRADRHITVQAIATYYEAGAFLRQTSPSARNLFYLSLKTNYRF